VIIQCLLRSWTGRSELLVILILYAKKYCPFEGWLRPSMYKLLTWILIPWYTQDLGYDCSNQFKPFLICLLFGLFLLINFILSIANSVYAKYSNKMITWSRAQNSNLDQIVGIYFDMLKRSCIIKQFCIVYCQLTHIATVPSIHNPFILSISNMSVLSSKRSCIVKHLCVMYRQLARIMKPHPELSHLLPNLNIFPMLIVFY
jgi:hypothetical protein